MTTKLGSIRVLKIVEGAQVSSRASDGAIGYDVYAARVLDKHTKEPIGELPAEIPPGGSILIGIGVKMALPMGYEIQVRPRSGLASKYDIELSNSPGTVDPDFRGEVGVLLRNRGDKPFTVTPNMRVAQMIFAQVEIPELLEVQSEEELPSTRRAEGGFGSTGLNGRGIGTEGYDRELSRLDKYFMTTVLAVAGLSNCARGCEKNSDGKYKRNEQGELIGQTRRYGCVIAQDENIIATGFNAQYPGSALCSEVGCQRDEQGIPSGEKIEVCRAVHAEQKAINTAARLGIPIANSTLYCNAEPCLFCARMIADSGIQTLVILKGGYGSTHGLHIIREAGIKVREVEL